MLRRRAKKPNTANCARLRQMGERISSSRYSTARSRASSHSTPTINGSRNYSLKGSSRRWDSVPGRRP